MDRESPDIYPESSQKVLEGRTRNCSLWFNVLMCLGNWMESDMNGEGKARQGEASGQGLVCTNPSVPGRELRFSVEGC